MERVRSAMPDCCHKPRNAGRGAAANDETKMFFDEIRLKQARGMVTFKTTVVHLPPDPEHRPREPRFPERGFRFSGHPSGTPKQIPLRQHKPIANKDLAALFRLSRAQG
jgi:hypothetical protein